MFIYFTVRVEKHFKWLHYLQSACIPYVILCRKYNKHLALLCWHLILKHIMNLKPKCIIVKGNPFWVQLDGQAKLRALKQNCTRCILFVTSVEWFASTGGESYILIVTTKARGDITNVDTVKREKNSTDISFTHAVENETAYEIDSIVGGWYTCHISTEWIYYATKNTKKYKYCSSLSSMQSRWKIHCIYKIRGL